MKKFIFLFLLGNIVYSQNGFNYKALITNNGSVLTNQSVDVKFTILENQTTAIYQENQTTSTDNNGIITILLGEGNVMLGDFISINWANSQSLKVEIDTGSGYQDFGTNEFKYVPIAKYAETAGNVPTNLSDLTNDLGFITSETDGDVTNELQTLSISGNILTISDGNDVTLPSSSGSDVDFLEVGTDATPDNILDDIYHKGNISVGHATTPNAKLDIKNTGTSTAINSNTGIKITNNNSSNTDKIGVNTSLDASGTAKVYGTKNYLLDNGDGDMYGTHTTIGGLNGDGDHYGNYLNLTGDGTGIHTGSKINLSTNGTSLQTGNDIELYTISNANTAVQTGVKTHIYGEGTGDKYGVSNLIDGNADGNLFGTENTISNTGNGTHYGNYNSLTGDGIGEHYGNYIELSGTGAGNQYGVKSSISNSGNGEHFGAHNSLSGTGTGIQLGVINYISNTGDDTHYGISNLLLGTGAGVQYGAKNYISNSGNGWHYGTHNTLSGTGTGKKYGIYAKIDTSAGGEHYAVYGEAEKNASDVYAGYFKGNVKVTQNVNITQKLTAPDSGDTDMKAYIYGSIASNGNFTVAGAHSDGFTVNRVAIGKYEITFTNSPGNKNYTVMATMRLNSIGFITVLNDTYYFQVKTYDTSGNSADKPFNFVVFKK